MAEWLESKLFKVWFWKAIRSNLGEWWTDAPVILKSVAGITIGLLGWLYLISFLAQPNPIIRGTGVLLQLIGFVLAAYGLERTLEVFGRIPSTSRILPWVYDFTDIFDTTIRGSVEVEDGPETIDAHGSALDKGLTYPETLSERIRKLEQSLADVRDEVKANRRHIDEKTELLENKIEEEVKAFEERVQDVREKIREANVGEGALWLEWSGVSFFVYGVPLASFPSLLQPAYWVLAVPVVAGMLLWSLHWYAD
ncbi:hypothetical protein [Salinibacter grassmerensis]|uniref:hypothetical protein n=1 Tax=Salinibacter grassmerensis TaxID=3040353 RepID=UPI0021E76220|nr:hypothetical protein [Salinibacter grassmerensis]